MKNKLEEVKQDVLLCSHYTNEIDKQLRSGALMEAARISISLRSVAGRVERQLSKLTNEQQQRGIDVQAIKQMQREG